MASAVVLLTLLVECVLTSVYPFYAEKDLVFDPAILGDRPRLTVRTSARAQ